MAKPVNERLNKQKSDKKRLNKDRQDKKNSPVGIKRFVFMAFWLLILTSTFFVISMQFINYRKYCAQEAEINAKIELEQLKQQDLTKSKDYYSSDAFVEKAAREQLGLVMPDEYLFYTDSGN